MVCFGIAGYHLSGRNARCLTSGIRFPNCAIDIKASPLARKWLKRGFLLVAMGVFAHLVLIAACAVLIAVSKR